jgi:outer membrane protein assembly factor BamB
MLSRRDVIRLGAAGLIAPALDVAAVRGSVARQAGAGGTVPMDRGNPGRTGEMPGPAPESASGVEVLWLVETSGQLRTSPAVADGAAYIGSGDGNVYALSLADGTERWRFPTGDRVTFGAAISGDTVYFGSEDHHLYALDATTGAERWRVAIGPDPGPPAVVDDVVLVNGGPQGRMYLVALDARDGAERWRLSHDASWPSAPAVADGAAYIVTGANVHAVDLATGEERWRAAAEGGDQRFGLELAVANDTVYVPGSGICHALDVESGTERWRTTPDQFVTGTIAVAGDTLFAGSGEYHTIAAADARDGTSRWLHAIDGTTPDVAQPSRYGVSHVTVTDDLVFATRAFNELYALDRRDGSERWAFPLQTGGKNVLTAPVIVDGMVLIGSSLESGTLYALGGRVARLEAGASAQVSDGAPLRGAPAPSGVVRADLPPGATVTLTGAPVTTAGVVWWPVRVESTGQHGWVEASGLTPMGAAGST